MQSLPQYIPTLTTKLAELDSCLGDSPQYTLVRQSIAFYKKELRKLSMEPNNLAYLSPDDPLVANIVGFMNLPACVHAMRNSSGSGYQAPVQGAFPAYPSQTSSSYGRPGFNFSRPTHAFASGNKHVLDNHAPAGSGSHTARQDYTTPPIPRGVPRDATPYIWGKCKGWLTQNTNGTYFYSKDVMGDGLLYVCAFKIGVGVSSVRGWVYIPG